RRSGLIGWVEIVLGVELRIAQELERGAVKLVGARFDCDVHYSAAGAPEFGGHGIRLYFEFGDRVRRRPVNKTGFVGQVLRKTVVVDTIEQIAFKVGVAP